MSSEEGTYSVLRIPVQPGREDEFVATFARLRIFALSDESGGFRGARLLRPVSEGDTTFVVVARWDSPAAYQRWLDDPLRESLRAELEPLTAGAMSGGAYSVAEAYDA
jgi:heme-degrading monooxygenase HmoA